MRLRSRLLAALAAAALAVPAAARDGRKIYVSVDMEGIGGVVSAEQLSPAGFEYARFREFMTEETNVALAAAREAGATEFVVGDSHGNMQNLLIEKLPKDVQVVRSAPRPLMMMQGLDESFDGVIFIGYHASTTNPEGIHSARTLTPEAARDVIREKVKAAMARRASFRPYVVKTPVELDIRFKNYRPAEVLSYLPVVRRTDAHSVRFVAKDMLEASRFMEFVLTYQPSLEP